MGRHLHVLAAATFLIFFQAFMIAPGRRDGLPAGTAR
jgi:hypothetical protein